MPWKNTVYSDSGKIHFVVIYPGGPSAQTEGKKIINQFIEKHELLPILLAVESFNKETGTYLFDSEIYDEANNQFTAQFIQDNPAYMEEAYEEFVTKVLGVSKDNMTGFVSISIKLTSSVLAKKLLDSFINELSELLKKREIENTSKHITYLNQELEKIKSTLETAVALSRTETTPSFPIFSATISISPN